MDNLFGFIPDDLPEEFFETLVRTEAIHIERIISSGHTSPKGQWYDQDQTEWVLLVRGAARLVFEGGNEHMLVPGDWLEIPAHQKHRVAWTDPDQETVWLAVHYR